MDDLTIDIYAQLSAHNFLLSILLTERFLLMREQKAVAYVQRIKQSMQFVEFPEDFDQELASELGPILLEKQRKTVTIILDETLKRVEELRAAQPTEKE